MNDLNNNVQHDSLHCICCHGFKRLLNNSSAHPTIQREFAETFDDAAGLNENWHLAEANPIENFFN